MFVCPFVPELCVCVPGWTEAGDSSLLLRDTSSMMARNDSTLTCICGTIHNNYSVGKRDANEPL